MLGVMLDRRRCLAWLSLALLPAKLASAAEEEHLREAEERSELGTAQRGAPTSPTARRLMHGLLCQCPGCQPKRITIEDCTCGYAAKQREEVLAVLALHDLSSAQGEAAAEQAVRADQVERYGRKVVAEPATPTVWMLPAVATLGGLGLVVAGGRRWRSHRSPAVVALPSSLPEDEALAERLEDELADVD